MQLKTMKFNDVSIENILLNLQTMSAIQSGVTLLDSNAFDEQNNTTYVCIRPKHLYEMRGNDVYIDDQYIGRGKSLLYAEMRKLLHVYGCDTQQGGFIGGFVGYVSYEATPLFLNIPIQTTENTPSIVFRFYTQVLKIQDNEGTLMILEGECFEEWQALLAKQKNVEKDTLLYSDQMADETSYVSSLGETGFMDGVSKTKAEIEQGAVYQLNMTRRLRKTLKQDNAFLLRYYLQIQRRNKAPYSVLWLDQNERIQFASSSPEQFFRLSNRMITTKPIKGTRPRKNDVKKDALMRKALIESEKDHAELLMITDLLRNDLNRVVENNSVEVIRFAEVCANPTVFHLVSTIQARLPETKDAFDILDGLFPGGSITGAPKMAAVSFIDQFEACSRGLYTGCCGYISINQDADFNILIRTVFQKHDTIDIHVGGGIVYESVPHLEYLETKQKAKALLEVIKEVE